MTAAASDSRRLCIASRLSERAVQILSRREVDVIDLGENRALERAVCFHSDLSALPLGENELLLASEMRDKERIFSALNVKTNYESAPLGKKYPHDARLNCVLTDNFLICSVDTVSRFVLQYFKDKRDIINVRQGYTRCSCVPVGGAAVITDDVGIARACEGRLSVLLVKKGFVALDGYDYGFIGGCAGMISESELAFNGSLDLHPDGAQIRQFCKKHSVEAISLGNHELRDIGSILYIGRQRL